MSDAVSTDGTSRFFIGVIGTAVIALILKELSNIFLPLVVAYFLFFLFSPLNNFLRGKKIPQFAVILLDLLIMAFLIWLTFNFLFSSFSQFGQQAPAFAEKFNNIVRNTAVSLKITDPYFTQFSLDTVLTKLNFGSLAGGVFSSSLSLLGGVLFILFFFIFVMIGHNTIYAAVRKRFVHSSKARIKKFHDNDENISGDDPAKLEKLHKEKADKEDQLDELFNSITGQIQRYIIAKVVINTAAGAVVFVLLYFMGIDFPLIWALFTFLFNFIPTIGSAIALVLPVLMALIQSGSTGYALLVALLLGIVQTLAFNLAEPAILGKRLNLNPLLILISLLIWGYIWGIPGMLLSVPLTAIIQIIVSNSDSPNLQFLSGLMGK